MTDPSETADQRDRVYLAGPIQSLDDNGLTWREATERQFKKDFDFVNPIDLFNWDEYDDISTDDIEEIVEVDKEMISEADGVLVGWRRVPSVGTPMEILYCYERDIPVTVWLEPGGSREPLEKRDLSPWLTYHTDGIYLSAGEALGALEVAIDE